MSDPADLARCTETKLDGERCRMPALTGKAHCRFHSMDPEDVAKRVANCSRGGKAPRRNVSHAPPIADVIDVASLDLSTASGVKELLGAALRQLAQLPLDAKVANAIAQAVTAQRTTIVASDLEVRLAAIEAERQQR